MYGIQVATWNCWISYRNGYVTVGPSLAASLEFGTSSKCSQLKFFYRYYFGRCSSELAEMVPLPYSRGRSTRYSDRKSQKYSL